MSSAVGAATRELGRGRRLARRRRAVLGVGFAEVEAAQLRVGGERGRSAATMRQPAL